MDESAPDGPSSNGCSLAGFGSVESGRDDIGTAGAEHSPHHDDHHPNGVTKAVSRENAVARDAPGKGGEGEDDQEVDKQPGGNLWSSSPFAWQPLHQGSLAAFQ